MNPINSVKRAIMAMAIVASLVVPGVASAATSSGATAETLTIPATVSMVVPATTTYDASYNASIALTNVQTNATSGAKIQFKVNAAAAGKLDPAKRSATSLVESPGGGSGLFTTPSTGALPTVLTDLWQGTYAQLSGGTKTVTLGLHYDVTGQSAQTLTGTVDFTITSL